MFLFDFQRRLVEHPPGTALLTHLALWMLLCSSQNINGEINPPASVSRRVCASSHVARCLGKQTLINVSTASLGSGTGALGGDNECFFPSGGGGPASLPPAVAKGRWLDKTG